MTEGTQQSDPPFTLDELRAFVREFAVVVRPGETLILRVSENMTPSQVRELHRALNAGWPEGDPYYPFRVMVVPGEDLGVAQALSAQDVYRANQHEALRYRARNAMHDG